MSRTRMHPDDSSDYDGRSKPRAHQFPMSVGSGWDRRRWTDRAPCRQCGCTVCIATDGNGSVVDRNADGTLHMH